MSSNGDLQRAVHPCQDSVTPAVQILDPLEAGPDRTDLLDFFSS